MSYRLTFKFLSEQCDYLIFVLSLTEVSHYNVLFLKHDNNPQIPNNVIVNKKKNPPVFTILFSIKMSNFYEGLCVWCSF